MKLSRVTTSTAGKLFFVIFALGVLARSYDLNAHWKNNDHYNFGGTMMTHSLKCLREAPLEVSRGLIVTECDTPHPDIYENYTPFSLYGMWLTTEIFGTSEWAHRLFFLIFSSLNILLVFFIAREVWPQIPRMWLLATFFQAFFLSPMYFGTHMDPVTEFTLAPMLASSLAALRGRLFGACVWALVAGLTTWIGYFQFFPLLLYAFSRRNRSGKARYGEFAFVSGACVFSALICFGSMIYLRGSWDIMEFVTLKLTNPEYIRPTTWTEKLFLPLQFVRNFFQSLARLLGPLFATFAFYEFFFGSGRVLWKYRRFRSWEKEHWAYVLTGMAFFGYLIPGFKYAMVHIHNYIFAIPMWALLAANFANRLWEKRLGGVESPKIFGFLALVFIASYPYGIYQSSLPHDVINSVFFVGTVLAFLVCLFRQKITQLAILVFLLITAATNFSQVVNYRNEADTEYPFCQSAREEFARTGQPVRTKERRTRTKDYLYCRGIPIIYEE